VSRYRKEVAEFFRNEVHRSQFRLSMGDLPLPAATVRSIMYLAAQGIAETPCDNERYRDAVMDVWEHACGYVKALRDKGVNDGMEYHNILMLGTLLETAIAAFVEVTKDEH